jgi:methyl-accepting chemotaxis protein
MSGSANLYEDNMFTIRKKFIVVGVLIFVSVVGILLVNNYLIKKTQVFSNLENSLSTIRGDMLMLRRNEKDFLARLDLKYEQQFADNFEKLLVTTNKLEQAVLNAGLDIGPVVQMRESFTLYDQKFLEIIAIQKTIGVNPKDGYYGALRQAVHGAEKNIKELNDQQLRADMLQLRRNEKDFMLRSDEKYIDRFNKNITVFDQSLTQSNHPDAPKNAIKQSMKDYQSHFIKLAEGMKQKGLDSKSGIVGSMRAAIHESEVAIADVYTVLNEGVVAGGESNDSVGMTKNIVSSILVILIVGLLYWLGKGILDSITQLAHVIRYSSENKDLSLRFDSSRRDEMGDMGEAFNGMLDNFQSTVLEVSNASIQMSAAAEELSAVTLQTDGNIHRQKSETAVLVSAIRNMVESTLLVAENSTLAAESSSKTTEEATQGREVINGAVTTIGSLAESISSASTSIERVDQDSEKIGSVLDVIKGIAEQTNLLALNAAIEAARAGEQGRGFAVVADEVRTLAGRTQESTQEIQAMIESLQMGTKEAVSLMTASSDLTTESVEKTSSADQQFLQIAKSIEHISRLNSEISSSAQAQESNSEEVNNNINAITEITSQTELGAKETSEASRDLAKIATQLHVLVSQFKLG